MRIRPAFFTVLPLLAGGPTVRCEIRITATSDLRVGTVIPGTGPGSLVLEPDGKPALNGVFIASGRPRGPAVLHLEGGPPNRPFTVSFPDRSVVPWPKASLELDRFQPALRPHRPVLAFDGDGKAELRVGATLKLPAQAGPGELPRHPVEVKVTCEGETKTALFHLEGRIMLPLRAREAESLDFGRLLSPDQDATVVLDPATGVRSVQGGSAGILAGKAWVPGRFELDGDPLEKVSIRLPGPERKLFLRSPGGDSIEILRFTTDPPGGLVLDGGGKGSVKVGATLVLKGRQPPGRYTGFYEVVFAYP